MKHYLYPNGQVKNTSLLNTEFVIQSIISVLFFAAFVVIIKVIVEWGFGQDSIASNIVLSYYTLPILLFFIYIFIKSRLPMVRIDKDIFVTYRGLIRRDKIAIADIRTIETELNDDSGIQLIIYKKSGGKYTAEIPYNSCSDGDFVKFMQEHRPELEVITHTQMIRKSHELQAINSTAEPDQIIGDDDELWLLVSEATNEGNINRALSVLMELHKRGHFCDGLIGYFFYTQNDSELNKHKALPYFKQGETYQCELSLMCLGVMHMNQEIKDSSPEVGFKYLIRARGVRDSLRFHHLGYCYLEGQGTDIDLNKAKYNFLKAIALGDRGAYMGLARLAGLKRNRCAVFRLVLKAQSEAPLK